MGIQEDRAAEAQARKELADDGVVFDKTPSAQRVEDDAAILNDLILESEREALRIATDLDFGYVREWLKTDSDHKYIIRTVTSRGEDQPQLDATGKAVLDPFGAPMVSWFESDRFEVLCREVRVEHVLLKHHHLFGQDEYQDTYKYAVLGPVWGAENQRGGKLTQESNDKGNYIAGKTEREEFGIDLPELDLILNQILGRGKAETAIKNLDAGNVQGLN